MNYEPSTPPSVFLLHNVAGLFGFCPVQSAGELENDEHTAGVVMQMVRTACRFRLRGAAEPPFKRMTVMFDDYVYVVTVSGQKVFVVKRQNIQREPVNV
uniref:Ragulator complex protein LAMTOR4 n=1 Tax=Denticeps clupeoides TaxID=299321 RepID=A0AAY4BSH2_9TELE